MGKAKPAKNEVLRCCAPGCNTRLNPTNKALCKHCGKETCLDHAYQVEHECSALASNAPAPAKAAAGNGGIVVESVGKKTAAAAVSEPNGAAAANGTPTKTGKQLRAPVPGGGVKRTAAEEAASKERLAALGGQTEQQLMTALVSGQAGTPLSAAASDGSPEVRRAARDAVVAIAPQLRSLPEDEQTSLISTLTLALTLGGDVGAASLLACAAAALGAHKVAPVLPQLEAAMQHKKQMPQREGACTAFGRLCELVGRPFEAYALRLAPSVLQCIGTGSPGSKAAAEEALAQLYAMLAPQSKGLFVPVYLKGMEDKSHLVKVCALTYLGDIAQTTPSELNRHMPAAFPIMLECLKDTHTKVAEVAEATLLPVCDVIENPEVKGMMNLVVDALHKPAECTDACLDKLMETTFCNPVDAAALAVIFPVIMRGLQDRFMELKKKATMTCGNICALVLDTRDLAPFVPKLGPELDKAEEHQHPDVRQAATRAKESFTVGLAAGSEGADASSSGADETPETLAAHLRGAIGSIGIALDETTTAYIAQLGANVLARHASATGPPETPESRVAEVEALLTPVLEGADVVVDKRSALWAEAARHRREHAADSDGKDYIVKIQGLILAFAGRVLLSRTKLLLERGKRYGLVGQNGTGKTTLLNRVAAKDIYQFPQDKSVYYVQHEILAEKDAPIFTFMQSQVPEGTTDATLREKLEFVGFTDELMKATVSSLSGGWRMKLAIARSMLWDADILLLDEPTNHLDTGAIQWLINHLRSLTNTTICLVSHDYDFLGEVLTNVIHICDKSLAYYDMGFKEFQGLKPEICAALPSTDSAISKAADMPKSASKGDLTRNGSSSALSRVASSAALSETGTSDAGASEDDGTTEENGDGAKFGLDLVGEDGSNIAPITFPNPGQLEGVSNRNRTVMSIKALSFKYPGTERWILENANAKLCLNSRVALVGLNGAGKTTLMKLMVGQMVFDPSGDSGSGEIYQHHNLRLAYLAQHSMHHLESSLELTPMAYLQNRYYEGRDREMAKMDVMDLTPEEKERSQTRGQICEVVGRATRGNTLQYEVRKTGRDERDTQWYPIADLQRQDPHVMKLVRNYDELMKAKQSGMDLRPVTRVEVTKHLAEFGINEDLAMGKIKRMSGGQRSRLVLAAAMWSFPHIIAMDEPTNYLDNDTLAALTNALRKFKGAVMIISHNDAFVNHVCNEEWRVGEGKVVPASLTDDPKEAKKMELRRQKEAERAAKQAEKEAAKKAKEEAGGGAAAADKGKKKGKK